MNYLAEDQLFMAQLDINTEIKIIFLTKKSFFLPISIVILHSESTKPNEFYS